MRKEISNYGQPCINILLQLRYYLRYDDVKEGSVGAAVPVQSDNFGCCFNERPGTAGRMQHFSTRKITISRLF